MDFASGARRLRMARVVAVVRTGNEIVGVGAIKQAWPRYAPGIARKSGFSFDRNMLELGYVARDPSHRGHNLSPKIVSTLLCTLPCVPLFATTSREKMKETLRDAGFVQEGNEWPGKDKKTLSLWLRPAPSK